MKALRTILSAIGIIVGAVLIVWWAVAAVVVDMVEDGTALRGMTTLALDSPAVVDSVANNLAGSTVTALADQGLNVRALGLEGEVSQAVTRMVGTDSFREALLEQADAAHAQVQEQLAAPPDESAPLTVSVNLSDAVNDRVDDLGVPAALVPELAVPPVTFQVLEAERFDQVRDLYDAMLWAQQWALWLGIVALTLGVLVSHRKRWFVAKALFAVGVLCLLVGGALTFVAPETIADALPGGDGGTWTALWQGVLTAEVVPVVAERALWAGGIAILAAFVATALGAALGGRPRARA